MLPLSSMILVNDIVRPVAIHGFLALLMIMMMMMMMMMMLIVPLDTFNNPEARSMRADEDQSVLVLEGRPVLLVLSRSFVLEVDVDGVIGVYAVVVEEDLGIAHLYL